jgi:hypothetical protein
VIRALRDRWKLWLCPGTNKASSSLFGSRIALGSGFNQYNLLF